MSRHARLRTTKRRPRAGAALVEFACVLPLLLLVFAASIELFRLNQMRHAADQAAYEACRHVIVPGANQAEAVAKAQQILAMVGVKKSNIQISPSDINDGTPEVTVNVDIPASGNSWIMPAFSQKSVVNSTSTLLTERNSAVVAAAIPK
jgi:Flp pilus assembly protein TadG